MCNLLYLSHSTKSLTLCSNLEKRRGVRQTFLADWNKIGEYRQHQTELNTKHENKTHVDYDYKVGDKALVCKDGILRKTQSCYQNDPWTITTVHTNGTISVQCVSKSERFNT
jgi:hypothetical protein